MLGTFFFFFFYKTVVFRNMDGDIFKYPSWLFWMQPAYSLQSTCLNVFPFGFSEWYTWLWWIPWLVKYCMLMLCSYSFRFNVVMKISDYLFHLLHLLPLPICFSLSISWEVCSPGVVPRWVLPWGHLMIDGKRHWWSLLVKVYWEKYNKTGDISLDDHHSLFTYLLGHLGSPLEYLGDPLAHLNSGNPPLVFSQAPHPPPNDLCHLGAAVPSSTNLSVVSSVVLSHFLSSWHSYTLPWAPPLASCPQLPCSSYLCPSAHWLCPQNIPGCLSAPSRSVPYWSIGFYAGCYPA